MNDYCFALASYRKCSYKQLRDFLVLPNKRKLQYITSSVDKDQVFHFHILEEDQQKNAPLLQTSVKKARMAD